MKCFCCAKEIVPLEGEALAAEERRIEEEDVAYVYHATCIIEIVPNAKGEPCRCAVVCWFCLCKIEPDMWESDETWATYKPAVPFDKLPIFEHGSEDCNKPEKYAAYQPT